jgi:hypothetical protein
MSQRTFGILGMFVLAGLAFVAGYWSEHMKYLRSVADLRDTDKVLAEARARQRMYHLEISLLKVLERSAARDYKEAEILARDFFIEVQAELARPDMTSFKSELQDIAANADEVRLKLDRGDQSVRDLLRGMMLRIAQAVEPPTPSDPPAILPSAPAPQN